MTQLLSVFDSHTFLVMEPFEPSSPTRQQILRAYYNNEDLFNLAFYLMVFGPYQHFLEHVTYGFLDLIEHHDLCNTKTNDFKWRSGLDEHAYTYQESSSFQTFLAVDRANGWNEKQAQHPIIQALYAEMRGEHYKGRGQTETDFQLECILYPTNSMFGIRDAYEMPTDRSNIYYHEGKYLDLSKYSYRELLELDFNVSFEDKYRFERLECVRSMYSASVPNVKLYYPEPYLASPSYIHSDIGYLHILQYQYWLWFVFVFLIVFFFITFLCTIRWCNLRTQPRRETRGVSRSKCGDLITASVPVTWAVSIIVSETTDALDYYDGFGTSEIVVGVRAYQWGWEYYYPKDIDLNYNLKPNYSAFIGNSIKYNTVNEQTVNKTSAWRYYQNKKTDEVITPAHLLLLPLDNNKVVNFVNFDNIGASGLKNSHAFKKIRTNSKVYNTNLLYLPNTVSSKYIKLNQLHTTDNTFYDSLSYGNKRQHTLTSMNATTNTYSSFLDTRSMEKFLKANLNYNSSNLSNKIADKPSNLAQLQTIENVRYNPLSSEVLSNSLSKPWGVNTHPYVLSEYTTLWNSINLDSDKKVFKFANRKLFNEGFYSDKGLNFHSNIFNESFNTPTNSLLDFNTTKDLLWSTSATNGAVLPVEQSVRRYNKISFTQGHKNLTSHTNTVLQYLNNVQTSSPQSLLNFYNSSNLNHLNSDAFIRLASNRLFFEAPYAPVKSVHSNSNDLNFDSTSTYKPKTIFNGNKVLTTISNIKGKDSELLKGRRDGALKALTTAYWDMFWSNSHIDLRLKEAINSSIKSDLSYLPLFTNYDDYDFRNAQAIEMLEEAFWETSYSGYNHYDYLNIKQNLHKEQLLNLKCTTVENSYYKTEYKKLLPKKPLFTPGVKDLSLIGLFYTNSLQADDLFVSPSNLMRKDFSQFVTSSNLFNIDESYLNIKEFNKYLLNSNQYTLNAFTNYQSPLSYINVLNTFRADYDDFTTQLDAAVEVQPLNLNNVVNDTNINTDTVSVNQPTLRFSNPLVLRSTAKNSVVTYNALQKVFRSRLDEGRSLTSIQYFSDVAAKQPYLSGGRVSYESLLGKNRESFFNATFYDSNVIKLLNFTSSPLNTYFYEFPFLSAQFSDAARHVWFDWYAKWGMYEVQPASSSKYSTLGVPYSRKHFDFSPEYADELTDNETYFTRISRSRKNYLASWMYSPYLFLRNSEWSTNSILSDIRSNTNSINLTTFCLHNMNWYWKHLAFAPNTSNVFTGSNSAQNIYIKSLWRPSSGIQGYYYNVNNLTDILTRREYMYRQYFEGQYKTPSLPNLLTANPNNPLISELKSSFLFIDPITYNSEYSRDFYYHSLAFFKFIIFKDMLANAAKAGDYLPINWSAVTEYLFFYFFNTNSSKSNNAELYKSQYRPLRKGVNSMLRLQSSGAVAMPIEIRIQILASSRDVIHSWAIPSAGIKIDCIPGYTSHRIMIFLLSGIYWGQCMEICGRYHHWMPIVVYFMKRDLFFLWCTHFVYKSGVNDMWSTNDRAYTNYIKLASYDKNTWLNEVARSF